MVSGVQSAMVLFLWCSLYFSIKNWQSTKSDNAGEKTADPESRAYPARFAVRTGSRIQVVSEENILWISAARDYVELHTLQTSDPRCIPRFHMRLKNHHRGLDPRVSSIFDAQQKDGFNVLQGSYQGLAAPAPAHTFNAVPQLPKPPAIMAA